MQSITTRLQPNLKLYSRLLHDSDRTLTFTIDYYTTTTELKALQPITAWLRPNFAAHCLALLRRIEYVSGWSLDQADRLSWLRLLFIFPIFSSNYQDNTLNWAMATSFHVLINSLFIFHPVIRRCVLWATDNGFK